MLKSIVIGIVFISLGIVFMTEPWQFFIRNEIMVKAVRSKGAFINVFKGLGLVLIIIGIYCFYSAIRAVI